MRRKTHLVASCSALELSVTAQLHLGHQKCQHRCIQRVVSKPVVWYKVNPNHTFLNILGPFLESASLLDRAKHKQDFGAGKVQDWSMKVQACGWEMVLPWTFLRK